MVPVVTATVSPKFRLFEPVIGIEAYMPAPCIAGSEVQSSDPGRGGRQVAKAFEFAKSIKGEKPLKPALRHTGQAGVEKNH